MDESNDCFIVTHGSENWSHLGFRTRGSVSSCRSGGLAAAGMRDRLARLSMQDSS